MFSIYGVIMKHGCYFVKPEIYTIKHYNINLITIEIIVNALIKIIAE